MRILHVGETIKGGVATVISDLINGQLSMGHEVSCLIPSDHLSELPEVDAGRIKAFTRTGRNITSFLSFTFAFIRAMRKCKPDILHIHSSFAGVLARLTIVFLFNRSKTRVIYSPHAFSFLMGVPQWRRGIYVNIERILSLATDKIICGSDYELNTGIESGLPKSKMVRVYNGIKDFGEEPQTIKWSIDCFRPIELLFVGRLDHQKGFDLLIGALSKLDSKKFSLTVVGESVNSNCEWPALKNVNYVGWKTRSEVREFMLVSDILVMPSRWESFGLVAIEAQCCCLPVIASNCSSLPEIVTHRSSGILFESESIQDLANCITLITEMDLNSMGTLGRQNVLNKFTSQRAVNETTSFYIA